MDLGKRDAPLFDRNAPAYRRKLWVRLEGPGETVHVVFRWRRIVPVLLLLALAGWLAAAGVVYAFVRVRHEFSAASYWNLAWPPRWPEHRRALGQHYLARGRTALAAGNFIDAAQDFGAGVRRVPDDRPARRELAMIYLRFGQPHAALDLLAVGLDEARGDLDYLKLAFGLLDETQEDARILELAQKYLPAAPDEILAHQFIALQAATACFHRGNYDAAEKTIADWRLDRSLEGQLLLARCDWERGYPDLALVRLEQQRERFPTRDELPLQLIRFHRELGHNEQALDEALLRHVADPASPGPRIDLLYAWQKKNDLPRLHREVESYLQDNAADPNALLLLAWFAADTRDLALARRVRDLAAARGFPLSGHELVLVQILVTRGDYREALAAAEVALQGPAGREPRFAAVLSGLRALACFGAGDPVNGEGYLRPFLLREHLRASDALLLAGHLNEIGARPQARRVLLTAVLNDPMNQAALTELVRLETTAATPAGLEEYLPRLLAMRKPSRAVLQEAYLKLDEATPARAALRHSIKRALANSPTTPEPGL
ncbi:MAG: hypothetical protein JWQ62_1302 [Lacunisphaera sp.]|nr:hypothetical protein [Lacunisphaera sp.]